MSSNGEFSDRRDDFENEEPADGEEPLEEENSEESLIVYVIPFYFNWNMKAVMHIKTTDESSWATVAISFYNVSWPLPKV